ncbi:hypothetical protein F4678DRAFT_442103 [Xylaria arbuscula]|nr:hypothetical protein F4678DRAFT_442103 [Xylaria arbuscula]
MTTWEISLEYLKKKHPEAAELLQLLGFFARSGVAEGILQDSTGIKSWGVGSYTTTRQLNSEQRDELSFLQSRARTTMSLGILISLSLVSKTSDKIVSVHPLVHEWIQARLKPTPAETKRVLRLCSLIIYQAFPLEGITSGHMSRFTDVPTFTPHLLEILDALQQIKHHVEPMPLELRTLLLAHLLYETRREIAYRTTDLPPLIVRVFPSSMSATNEPLDAIQSQLFDELRDVFPLWHTAGLVKIMKALQLVLSTYSSAPHWTPSRKVYMVALVTFVLEMFENWVLRTEFEMRSAFHNPPPHGPYPKVDKYTASTLYNILTFLSLETGKVPAEISFLQVRIGLVLARITTVDEYLKLPWHCFRDSISWEQVACVDLETALEYFATCARFSTPYPKDATRALLLAAETFRRFQQPNHFTDVIGIPFVSNSFGRDIESYIPKTLTHAMIRASKVLGDACVECGLALLNSLKSRTTKFATDERAAGITLLGILRALDEVWSVIQDDMTKLDNSRSRDMYLFTSDKRRFEFQRLYVHAHFLRADYSDAIRGLQELFQAEKVMGRFGSEYNNPRRLLLGQNSRDHGEDTVTKTPLLSYLFRPIWRNSVKHQLPGPGLNGFGYRRYFNSISDGFNSGEQAATWYAEGSRLEDLDVVKELLRIWIDCLGRLELADKRDCRIWQDEVDAITHIHSAETIVVVHGLAKASLARGSVFGATSIPGVEVMPFVPGSGSRRQTIGGDIPLTGEDQGSSLRDDYGRARAFLTIPEGNGSRRGNDNTIFKDMEFEMELE